MPFPLNEVYRIINQHLSANSQFQEKAHSDILAQRSKKLTAPHSSTPIRDSLSDQILKPISKFIKTTSQKYTQRENETSILMSQDEVQGYIAYYLPINLEKFRRILPVAAPISTTPNMLRVLDYGCGPGTATIALSTFREGPFTSTLYDSNPHMLSEAEVILQQISANFPLHFSTTQQSDKLSGPFDLALLGHVLNELSPAKALEVCLSILDKLSDQGMLFILETALQKQTREVMRLRDEILRIRPDISISYPCTHNLQCPMLSSSQSD